MLTHIHIKNFVIVKSLSLDFQNGLHVLTGETGAGKSIWIDAIEIGLGGRADAQMIFVGEKTCDITLCFDLQQLPDAKKWLVAHDLPDEDECIIRRIIDQEKPSRTTLNGVPVPQQLVRTFADHILCIHGQDQHQQLLKSDYQRDLLDRYADNAALLLKIHSDYDEWKSLDRQAQALQQQMKNKSSDLSLWQYQLEELEKLGIQDNEYESLFEQYQQLHHAKQFSGILAETLAFLDGSEHATACELTQQSLQCLKRIHSKDEKIENIYSLLQTASIHLDEARDALQTYCDESDYGSGQLEKIESRLALLQDTARKHHVDATKLSEVENALREKIQLLSNADDALLALEERKNQIIAAYQKTAAQLTQRRKKFAEQLSIQVTEHMQTLGMQGGRFEIQLTHSEAPIHFLGNEQIHFLIATNLGQIPQPLSHCVSGGELSRLSLIMQVMSAAKKNTPTLIFDEVDVGVGGKTADLIGRLLRALSATTQVLCVTHLPQVAANGHHHFLAEKITQGKTTSTSIKLLNDVDRKTELARMLSGSIITEKSVAYADELLATIG